MKKHKINKDSPTSTPIIKKLKNKPHYPLPSIFISYFNFFNNINDHFEQQNVKLVLLSFYQYIEN